MIGDVVSEAKKGFGEAVIAGNEDVVSFILDTALSPPGLILMGILLVYFIIKGRR